MELIAGKIHISHVVFICCVFSTYPKIAFAGKPSFGHTQRIENGAQNVEQSYDPNTNKSVIPDDRSTLEPARNISLTHQDQPPETGLADFAEPALHQTVMNCGHNTRQAETRKGA